MYIMAPALLAPRRSSAARSSATPPCRSRLQASSIRRARAGHQTGLWLGLPLISVGVRVSVRVRGIVRVRPDRVMVRTASKQHLIDIGLTAPDSHLAGVWP